MGFAKSDSSRSYSAMKGPIRLAVEGFDMRLPYHLEKPWRLTRACSESFPRGFP